MKLVNAFIKDPCTGWTPLEPISDYKGSYSCTDEFAEDFINTFGIKFRLFKKEVELIGSAYLVHLTLTSVYADKHPESNQAHYYLDAVLVNDR